jgi:hypothetical protein
VHQDGCEKKSLAKLIVATGKLPEFSKRVFWALGKSEDIRKVLNRFKNH